MSRILLIAANFVREQRWYVVLMLAWILGSSAAIKLASDTSADDALFFIRQQGAYALALTLIIASGAVYGERRSRRILSPPHSPLKRQQRPVTRATTCSPDEQLPGARATLRLPRFPPRVSLPPLQ